MNQKPRPIILQRTGNKRTTARGERPEASVLVSRRNFGIRAVFTPSFGDIFAANAVNNGLLPARIGEETADEIIALLGDGPMAVTIDLRETSLTIGERKVSFALDSAWREKLLNGWVDIDLSLKHGAEIAAFRARHATSQTWAFASAETQE